MTYSVYQHWDPLKVMVVGKSYPPELYDYITNEKIRKVFYQIAEETEEDYQKMDNLLTSLGVKVLRCNMDAPVDRAKYNISQNLPIQKPLAMQPRDHTIMLGETFYCSKVIEDEMREATDLIQANGNKVQFTVPETGFRNFDNYPLLLNAAMTARIGKDLIVGSFTNQKEQNLSELQKKLQNVLPDYRVHLVDTQGHTDGTFCPVVPGLLISTTVPFTYKKTFPDWEVVFLAFESWKKVRPFMELKKKNAGKWWVPGQELNQDFTDYVETWMNHWVGYVEESVFDVNMIVVDKKNVIVNGYNQKVFDAFSRYGITPHICNFRHRYFWDGGLHCNTTDLNRIGVMEDYFPERQ